MKIWVDADACPVVVKDILYKAAKRTQTHLILVANQYLTVPRSEFIKAIKVAPGFDVADNEIVRLIEAGDLLITGDIPLAAEAMEKGGYALNPRGEMYSLSNIKSILNMRDFMDTMRSSGVAMGGGPPPLNQRDRQNFANHLDRFLAQKSS